MAMKSVVFFNILKDILLKNNCMMLTTFLYMLLLLAPEVLKIHFY